ncbi:helix-turn-helix domain-containing protein [Chryseobacterium sp. D764]|jgi:AraC-like DNA-binding protein|uniref:helix-turn-helix domain-containing protein n=1 Tax=unclassified Chryseobacterium TaxID=2593645 RepID=UPI000987B384|nr:MULTISPECIES: helix-turn-helix domain-containing protein [unclassified Chryseobacterium]QXU50773.1 helix-turn-helix domain-containing protein [Chryseobacterium sp. D764]
MTIKIYRPENPILKKYIECFYILEQTSEESSATYFTFPSIYTIVTISEKTETLVTKNKITTRHCQSNPIETNLVSNFNEPVLISYEGIINEITTYFKPLGINAFIPNNLRDYSEGSFPDFSPYADYKETMAAILSLKVPDEKIRAIELYWLSKFHPFENVLLAEVLTEMFDTDNINQSMTKLSYTTGRSRTTINKHFDQYICKTPSQFKKIIRFRAAVQSQLENKDRAGLSYSMDYFDQSHMIRDFKKLTGFTPKVFFSKITTVEKDLIKWMFI